MILFAVFLFFTTTPRFSRFLALTRAPGDVRKTIWHLSGDDASDRPLWTDGWEGIEQGRRL